MPEYFAIAVIFAGLLLLGALLIYVLNNAASRIEASNNQVAEKLDALSVKLNEIESGLTDHGRDLDAIRAEFALHITSNEAGGADYEQAIKAASGGISSDELKQAYGLRDAEAQLLVAVYGNR